MVHVTTHFRPRLGLIYYQTTVDPKMIATRCEVLLPIVVSRSTITRYLSFYYGRLDRLRLVELAEQ